jgi:hypothetical protein
MVFGVYTNINEIGWSKVDNITNMIAGDLLGINGVYTNTGSGWSQVDDIPTDGSWRVAISGTNMIAGDSLPNSEPPIEPPCLLSNSPVLMEDKTEKLIKT